MTQLREVLYRRASKAGGDQYVEVAFLPSGWVAIRKAGGPEEAALLFSRQAWTDFIRGVEAGEFDPA